MRGMFALTCAKDLFAKLGHDLARLRKAPSDAYAAFDFFVTAEHIPEWMDPPRPELRRTDPFLQLVSHVANGAKHFVVSDRRHQSVSGSQRKGGYFSGRYFGKRYFAGGYFGGNTLVLVLDGTAAELFGAEITVIGLAEKVYKYWDSILQGAA